MARKRKRGDKRKRTASGQLSRAGQRTQPSEWVQEQRERFGDHYGSALGRAFITGHLGEGSEAKARLDAGNLFTMRYARVFGTQEYTCPLDDSVGGAARFDDDRAREERRRVLDTIADLDRAGLRPWLDQLLSRQYTDTGPYWLDKLIAGTGNDGHLRILAAAVRGLDVLLGEQDARELPDVPLHRMRA